MSVVINKIMSLKKCIYFVLLILLVFTPSVVNAEISSIDNSISFFQANRIIKKYLKQYPNGKQDSVLSSLVVAADPDDVSMQLAVVYYNQAKKATAINEMDSLCNKSIAELSRLNDSVGVAYNYLLISKFYFELGDNKKIEKKTIQALHVFDSFNDTLGVSECNNLLGKMYMRKRNLSLAKEKFSMAYDLCSNSSNYKQYSLAYKINLGVCLFDLKDYLGAINIYQEIIEASTANISMALYNNLANSYSRIGKHQLALEYIKKAIEFNRSNSDIQGLANCYNNCAFILINNHSYEKAKEYIQLSQLNNKAEDVDLQRKNIWNLCVINTYLNNPDSAIYYSEEYNLIRDSLRQLEYTEELLRYEAEFKSKEKDKEIELLNLQQELSRAELKSRNIVIYTIGALASVLFVLGGFFAIQRKRLHKSNKLISKSRKQLAVANSDLHTSNKAREKLLSIIGHDLRGPVGGLKELLDIYIEMDQFDHEEIRTLLRAVRESSASTFHLLENLLSWANSQRGDILVNTEQVNVKELVDNTVQALKYATYAKHLVFDIIVPSKLIINADNNLLRVVLRNLISNAIKFSPQFGNIQISALQKNNQAIISIQDVGQGMTREEITSIFEKKEEFFVSDGNSANKGSGLGLILCKEFVEKMDGFIWVEEEAAEGCTFSFSLPVFVEENTVNENVCALKGSA